MFLVSGGVGPRFVSAIQTQGSYRGTKGSWRQDPTLSGGGQLWDSGSHLMDIIYWISGLKPVEVFSYANQFDTRVDIPDSLSIKYRNGALASVAIVRHANAFHEEITMGCDKGAILIGRGGQPNSVSNSHTSHKNTGRMLPSQAHCSQNSS